MRIEDCEIGQAVVMKDREGCLVGDIVELNRTRLRVKFRNRNRPEPVTVDPRRIWAEEDQLDLFRPSQHPVLTCPPRMFPVLQLGYGT